MRHRNLVAGVSNAVAGGYFREHEENYAYLPMAWVGDLVFTVGAGTLLQFTTNIPERQETVLRDLREVAPTLYLAAPRAWDNMLTRIQIGMADSTPLKRKLFEYFMPRAIEVERRKLAGKPPSFVERFFGIIGEVLVFGPIKDFLGMTRARRAYTGGEAMGEDTFLFFRALGVGLRQFYGQTETAALTAAQSEGDVKLHTVGKPMPGVDVKIDDSGEIVVRSGSVIDGYFDDPEASKKALIDGWLHTGDAGYIEPDGQLVVLGRVNEVVRTLAGERFIPNYIENRIKFSPYVRNVAVVGAGRDVLTAIVCIDLEAAGHWAEERGISFTSYADLSQKPEVYELIGSILNHVNKSLPVPLRIRRFVNLHKDFDPDDGEVTRTRKLRRNIIEERYAALITALYAGTRFGRRKHAHYLRDRTDWNDQPDPLHSRGGLTVDFGLLGELALTGALVGAMYGLVALGIVLIYKTSGTANFAQGAIAMMGGYVAWVFAAGLGLPMWLAVMLAVAVMFGFGVLVERTVLRRMVGQPVIMVVMLTFGIELLLRGAVPGFLGSAVKRLEHRHSAGPGVSRRHADQPRLCDRRWDFGGADRCSDPAFQFARRRSSCARCPTIRAQRGRSASASSAPSRSPGDLRPWRRPQPAFSGGACRESTGVCRFC